MTSAARLRYGLRPRLATLTAMRPPGSSTRTHSANTSCSSSRYSRYELGTPSRSSSSSYCLPGEVRRRGDDQRHAAVGERPHVAGVAAHERLGDRFGGGTRVSVVEHRGARTAGRSRTRCAISRRPTPKFEVRVGRRGAADTEALDRHAVRLCDRPRARATDLPYRQPTISGWVGRDASSAQDRRAGGSRAWRTGRARPVGGEQLPAHVDDVRMLDERAHHRRAEAAAGCSGMERGGGGGRWGGGWGGWVIG